MTRNAIRSIIAKVPLEFAFGIWSNFERYPEFIEGVKQVIVSGRQIRWKMSEGMVPEEWESEIRELTPPRRIAWVTHRSGYPQHVVIALRPEGDDKTEITLGSQYKVAPGEADHFGDTIQNHLERFKTFAEANRPHDIGHPSQVLSDSANWNTGHHFKWP